jgi:hypothetical protein
MMTDPKLLMKRQAIAYWEHEPMNRPVKITSVMREPTLWAEGYITCYKFIAGRSLDEVERLLGLRSGELLPGAYLYEFMRLPRPTEFELRGYSQCPAGKPWTAESKYPAGQGVPQWEVSKDAYIPSRLSAVIASGMPVR